MEVFRESREAAFEAAFRKRHEIALTGVRIEEMVWSGESKPDFERIREFVRAQDIPESAKAKLEQILGAFEENERRLDEAQARIEAQMGCKIDENPERAGEVYFRSMEERQIEPSGRITLKRVPGFFLVEFERAQDFINSHEDLIFETERLPSGEVVCKVAGQFVREAVIRVTPHGLDATYTRRFEENERWQTWRRRERAFEGRSWNGEREPEEGMAEPWTELVREAVPMIFVNGTVDGRVMRNVFAHERQHEVYSYFKNHEDLFDGVRNELLARIRENDNEDHAVAFFKDEFLDSYWRLRSGMDEAAVENTRVLLEDIREQLAPLNALVGDAGRAIITYHLMDVPLKTIPVRLKSLRQYYGKFLEPLAPQRPPESSDYANTHVITVSDIRYGFLRYNEPLQSLANRVVESFDAWEDAYAESCQRAVLAASVPDTRAEAERLERMRMDAESVLDEFLRQSAGAENLHREEKAA